MRPVTSRSPSLASAWGRPLGLDRPVGHITLLGLVLLAGCGEASAPFEPVDRLPRDLTPVEQTVIRRSNAFGIDLVREVLARDDRANVVLSPFSASMALGMALEGADGETYEAMRTGLRFDDVGRDDLSEAYRGLLDLLPGLDPRVDVSIANSAWANDLIPFYPAYIDRLADSFHATAESRDFADPATLDAVNAWVDEHTKGRIEEILEELDPDLMLLLINAVAFDASWTTRFDPADTRPEPFTRGDGSVVTVDMMNLEGVDLLLGGLTIEGSHLAAVELPYGGGAYSMVVAVPWGGSIRDVIARMDGEAWDRLLGSFEKQRADRVALPRFRVAYDTFLNAPLQAMGMAVAFTGAADFSRMSPFGDEFCIDFVRQKTFIEVDEAGTRAAAATAVGVGRVSFTGLIADRPFLIAIRERLSGTILFIGVIGDPTEEEGPAPEEQRDCRYPGS